jgi:hypothetical protein
MIRSRFSGSSGLGSWSGKSPSGVHDHRPRHPAAAIHHHPQRLHHGRIDELQHGPLELLVDVDFFDVAAARRIVQTRFDQPADVLDPRIPGQGDRAALDQLGAGVGLRIVRGGAHQAAVELTRSHQVIEHFGADLPGVEDARPLADHPVPVVGREVGRGQAHVAAEAEAQLLRRLALEVCDHARERASDQLGRVFVDVAAVQPADVVGLEDVGGERGHRPRHATHQRCASSRSGTCIHRTTWAATSSCGARRWPICGPKGTRPGC